MRFRASQEILGEPAWDMLVELFIHECEDKPISTGSLCGAVERPLSSAMRVLQKLCDAELIYRAEDPSDGRSEEHTSELQSLMRISYAVFCLKKKKIKQLQDSTT